jgi:CubicO group peptidase (beta-lactamase class C family)
MRVARSGSRSHVLASALAAVLALAVACRSPTPAPAGAPAATGGPPIGTVRQIYDGALLPDIQVETFRHIDRLYPTRVVARGPDVHPLPASPTPITELHVESGGRRYDLYDYVSLNRVSGLLAIKDGLIVLELYGLGNDEATRWMSMSVVKSMTATLVGSALVDGHIASLDDAVTAYLPELGGSAYEGVTVRHLLTMTSGVGWNETYTDPTSDRRRMLEAQNAQEPGAILELMAALPRVAEPGTRWNYSTGETHVLGALVRAATGRPVAQYLSETLWAPFGMEADATWWLESPDGLEVGGSGLSATLRDYGRFGLFLLAGGEAGGRRMLPDAWVEEAGSPTIVDGEPVDYGFMLWPIADREGTIHAGAFEAVGIFGQHVYVNPDERLVIVVWQALPKPLMPPPIDDEAFFAALAAAAR